LYIYHLLKNPNKETKILFSSYIKQGKSFLKICVPHKKIKTFAVLEKSNHRKEKKLLFFSFSFFLGPKT
jgi:hypothetical protein